MIKKESDSQIDSNEISPLSQREIEDIRQELQSSQDELNKLKERRYELQSKRDYDAYLKRGFSDEDVQRFEKEDAEMKEWAEKRAEKYREDSKRVFCFPVNISEDTALVSYLRELESDLPLLNG